LKSGAPSLVRRSRAAALAARGLAQLAAEAEAPREVPETATLRGLDTIGVALTTSSLASRTRLGRAYGQVSPGTSNRAFTHPEVLGPATHPSREPMRADFPRRCPGRIGIHLKERSRRRPSVPNVLRSPQRPLGRDAIVQKSHSMIESALITDGGHRLGEAATGLGAGITIRGRGHEPRSATRHRPS
jgi:hypothetical protein